MNPSASFSAHIPSRFSRALAMVVALPLVVGLVGCGGPEEAWDSAGAPAEEQVGSEQIANTEQEVTNGVVNAVCAQSLTLRSSPGGSTIGTMYTGPSAGLSKFYVQSTSGSWSYGYSYSLGRWGYAMSYYLTSNYSESGTPGVAPYEFECRRSDGTSLGGGVI
jgi:hypothetical protein